jgi:orotate phosphoribosyltransferase
MVASPAGAASSAEWCRAFIDHHCIFRSPPGQALLTSKHAGRNTWQFYFPVATLNQDFAHHIGELFWNRYAARFAKQPFQLAGCESGGLPVVCALQASARTFGVPVHVFEAKKAAKTYGIKNWLEGVVDARLPVVLVDDVAGGGNTITAQARRLSGFGLELAGAFCIASCKHKPPLTIKVGDHSIEIESLFGPDDFTRSHQHYAAKYGRAPQFQGTVV